MRYILIAALLWPVTSFAQNGFDLGKAVDKKRKDVNQNRTILNQALKPFYTGRLGRVKVKKPKISVQGERVQVNYPAKIYISRRAYDRAADTLVKALNTVGKPVSKVLVNACQHNGCKIKKKGKKNARGQQIKFFDLGNLHSKIPSKHIRFFVNRGTRASTIEAWDVPFSAIDRKALDKYLSGSTNPMRLRLGLTDQPREKGKKRPRWSKKDKMIAENSVEVGIGKKTNRSFSGAHFSGSFVFVNPLPFYRGNFNVIWEVNQPIEVQVPFQLGTERASEVKDVRAIFRSKLRYGGQTKTVR